MKAKKQKAAKKTSFCPKAEFVSHSLWDNEVKSQRKRKKPLEISKGFSTSLVPRAGIEPAHPKVQDFESSASTSSATEAFVLLSD